MNISALEACHKDLFTDISELQSRYPQDIVSKILRVRDMYVYFLKSPSAADSEMVRVFTNRYKISRPTAYADLGVVKALLPSLRKESKDFHKWRTLEMYLETYRMAKAKMDVRSMERAAASYGRTVRAGEPESETIDVSKVIPIPWVPTDDPSVLGLPRLENREQKIRDLLKELSAKEPDILEVDYEVADTDFDLPPLNGDGHETIDL